MVAVNSIGGADTCVVLRCQVKVLETLQRNRDNLNVKPDIHIATAYPVVISLTSA